MSKFSERLDDVIAASNAGGPPTKIDGFLEEMDDQSSKDFTKALKNPAITHADIMRALSGLGLPLKSGAIASYRRKHWPEIFPQIPSREDRERSKDV